MNAATTILIPFQQYYFFTSDCGSFPREDAISITTLLGKALLLMAAHHPDILQDLGFFEKQRLRSRKTNCVQMPLGKETISALRSASKCGANQVSLLARALIREYMDLDVKERQGILAKV
ncbi:MAG: hypothetical protein WCS90_05860 [Bacilli bacterium]